MFDLFLPGPYPNTVYFTRRSEPEIGFRKKFLNIFMCQLLNLVICYIFFACCSLGSYLYLPLLFFKYLMKFSTYFYFCLFSASGWAGCTGTAWIKRMPPLSPPSLRASTRIIQPRAFLYLKHPCKFFLC